MKTKTYEELDNFEKELHENNNTYICLKCFYQASYENYFRSHNINNHKGKARFIMLHTLIR